MTYAENQKPLPLAYTRGHIYPEGRGDHFHRLSGDTAEPIVVSSQEFTEQHAVSANKTTRPLIAVTTEPKELTNPYPLSVSSNSLHQVIGVTLAPVYAQLNKNGETKITNTLEEHGVENDVFAEEYYAPQGTGLPYESFKLVFTKNDITPELVADIANVIGNVYNWHRRMSSITGQSIEPYPDTIPIHAPHPDSPQLTGSVKAYNRVFDDTQTLPSLDDVEMLVVDQQWQNLSKKNRHKTAHKDISNFSASQFDNITHDLSIVLSVVADLSPLSKPVTAETIVEYTRSIDNIEHAEFVLRVLEHYGFVKQRVKGIWEPTEKTQDMQDS